MMRKILSLFTSLSLLWMPVSVSYGATIMTLDPVITPTDDGTIPTGPSPYFGLGGFVDPAESVPLSIEDTVAPYKPGFGPRAVKPEDEKIGTSLNLFGSTSSISDWIPSYSSDYTCLSCTLTNFYSNQLRAGPNISRLISPFLSVIPSIQPLKPNVCLTRYDRANEVQDGQQRRFASLEPSNDLCDCLNESPDTTPVVTPEDLLSFRKNYEENAINENIKRFDLNKESMVEDFAELSAAIYFDQNFNKLSEGYYNENPDASKFVDLCSVKPNSNGSPLRNMLQHVQSSSDSTECTADGINKMLEAMDEGSSNLLSKKEPVPAKETEVEKVARESRDKLFSDIEADLRKPNSSGVANEIEIASSIEFIKKLNIDTGTLRTVYDSKSVSDSLFDVIRKAYESSIVKATQDLSGNGQKNNNSPGQVHESNEHASNPAAMLAEGVHAVAVAGGQAQYTPYVNENLIARGVDAGSDIMGKIANDYLTLLPEQVKDAASVVVPYANHNYVARERNIFQSKFSELSASNKEFIDAFTNSLSSSPLMRMALKNYSAFDELGQNSHLAPEMQRFLKGRSLFDNTGLSEDDIKFNHENSPKRFGAFLFSACKGKDMKDIAICNRGQKSDDVAKDLNALNIRINDKARNNLALRCGKIEDKMRNYCRAFSNKMPLITSTDARSLLHSNYFSHPNSVFKPVPKDAEENKLKTAQIACYFSLRDKIASEAITESTEKTDNCKSVEAKFLSSGAIKSITQNNIFGKGCANTGNQGTQTVVAGVGGTRTETITGDETRKSVDDALGGRAGTERSYRERTGKDKISSVSESDTVSSSKVISSSLPGSKSNEEAKAEISLPNSEEGNPFVSPFDPNFSPASSNSSSVSAKPLSQDEMKEIDPQKAAQISSNDQALKDLQARLDESEKKLNEKLKEGKTSEASQISNLIAEMKSQREQMQLENEKLRKEMQEIAAAKQQSNNGSSVARAISSDFSNPTSFPTPGAFSGNKASPISNEGSFGAGGGGSFSAAPTSNGVINSVRPNAPGEEYLGLKYGGSQGPTLRLTPGELAKAHFVPSSNDIYSALLSAPTVPVFVRENGKIVKYVCNLDEEGQCELDKDGKPILTSYKFEDPEFDNKKKVATRKPAAVPTPKERKSTSAAEWKKALLEIESAKAK